MSLETQFWIETIALWQPVKIAFLFAWGAGDPLWLQVLKRIFLLMPLGAIVLSSVIWGLYHTQYDGLIRLWVGICGGVLCAIRWRTNSTWLTVIAHSAINTVVFFTAGPYV